MILVSAAVLAGGRSSRMGVDKLGLCVDGVPLLDRVLKVLSQVFDDVFVVGRETSGYRSVSDVLEGQSALTGLHAAVSQARHPRVFVCGGDMPFLNPRLLALMTSIPAPALVPRTDRPHPLHAIYDAAACTPILEHCHQTGLWKMQRVLQQLDVRWLDRHWLARVDSGLRSLVNINTPADYEHLTGGYQSTWY